MSTIDDYVNTVSANVEKINLCAMVIEEVNAKLLDPIYPNDRADLLLATEDLTEQVLELLGEVRALVWRGQEASTES